MRPYTSMLVFVVILLVLRRVLGVPVSIVGSVVLTIVVSYVMRALTSRSGR
jgi:hypothetical protein